MSKKPRVSPELLQKIKDAVNILEVVGEHVVLRKTGANAVGLCPFHSERSPSFAVHEHKGLYHCYGCKKSGDLFTFFMEIHGLTFMDAVEELAERGRVPLPVDWGGEDSTDPEVQRKRKEARERLHVLYKLNLFAMAYYRQQLGAFPDAQRYCKGRGVHGDLAQNFRVGAALPAWDGLARHMTEKKAPLPQATELGLIRPSTKAMAGSTGYFDLFRNRVMFPIIDMRGRVAGFGGRTMPGELEAEGGAPTPKYMNSPESIVFQKSKLAFGLFQAQKHIREKDELILVEGYFDVLALHAAGFENAVATCGTSLTPDHLHLFKRFAKRVIVLFDGDKAGIAATERAMEIGLEHGLILHGAALPEGLDPDELLFDQETGAPLPEGKERMAALLAANQPLLATQIAAEGRRAAQGPEQRTEALKKAASWLKRYTDPVGRQVWVEEVVGHLGVSHSLLGQAMGQPVLAQGQSRPQGSALPRPHTTTQAPRKNPVPSQGQKTPRPKVAAKLSAGEQSLLHGLAKGGEYSELFVAARAQLPEHSTLADLFDYPPAREFVSRFADEPGFLERFRAAPESVLQEDLESQVRSTLTEALIASGASNPLIIDREDFRIALDKAIGRQWARFSQRIKTALTDAEAKQDAGLHAELMKEYLDVQRKIKEFISFYDEA